MAEVESAPVHSLSQLGGDTIGSLDASNASAVLQHHPSQPNEERLGELEAMMGRLKELEALLANKDAQISKLQSTVASLTEELRKKDEELVAFKSKIEADEKEKRDVIAAINEVTSDSQKLSHITKDRPTRRNVNRPRLQNNNSGSTTSANSNTPASLSKASSETSAVAASSEQLDDQQQKPQPTSTLRTPSQMGGVAMPGIPLGMGFPALSTSMNRIAIAAAAAANANNTSDGNGNGSDETHKPASGAHAGKEDANDNKPAAGGSEPKSLLANLKRFATASSTSAATSSAINSTTSSNANASESQDLPSHQQHPQSAPAIVLPKPLAGFTGALSSKLGFGKSATGALSKHNQSTISAAANSATIDENSTAPSPASATTSTATSPMKPSSVAGIGGRLGSAGGLKSASTPNAAKHNQSHNNTPATTNSSSGSATVVHAPVKQSPAASLTLEQSSASTVQDEQDVRSWVESVLKEQVLPSAVDLKTALHDGQVLCKLGNALRKDGKQIKINAGKFTASHNENISNYLQLTADVFKIPNTMSFKFDELYNGTGMDKVVRHLQQLKKQVSK